MVWDEIPRVGFAFWIRCPISAEKKLAACLAVHELEHAAAAGVTAQPVRAEQLPDSPVFTLDPVGPSATRIAACPHPLDAAEEVVRAEGSAAALVMGLGHRVQQAAQRLVLLRAGETAK